MNRRLLAAVLLLIAAIGGTPAHAVNKSVQFTADVWADNWFELYVNGKRVGQDSVPYKTERSFNMEQIRFSATYPLTIGLVAKDYVENASGLEYVGEPNQQIGDGGIIMQIRELASKRLVTATNSGWMTFVVNRAPTNPDCVRSSSPLADCKSLNLVTPKAWLAATFNASKWAPATEYTEQAVGVKEGYLQITWDPSASLVWSEDLKLDNVLLLRKRVAAPKATASSAQASFAIDRTSFPGDLLPKQHTCDGAGTAPSISWSAPPAGTRSIAVVMDADAGPPRSGEADVPHYYWVVYNLPANQRRIAAGATGAGVLGLNFKDRLPGYTPPCSQGPGAKQYRIRVFALSAALDLVPSAATGDALLAAIDGRTVATATAQFTYTRM